MLRGGERKGGTEEEIRRREREREGEGEREGGREGGRKGESERGGRREGKDRESDIKQCGGGACMRGGYRMRRGGSAREAPVSWTSGRPGSHRHPPLERGREGGRKGENRKGGRYMYMHMCN